MSVCCGPARAPVGWMCFVSYRPVHRVGADRAAPLSPTPAHPNGGRQVCNDGRGGRSLSPSEHARTHPEATRTLFPRAVPDPGGAGRPRPGLEGQSGQRPATRRASTRSTARSSLGSTTALGQLPARFAVTKATGSGAASRIRPRSKRNSITGSSRHEPRGTTPATLDPGVFRSRTGASHCFAEGRVLDPFGFSVFVLKYGGLGDDRQ